MNWLNRGGGIGRFTLFDKGVFFYLFRAACYIDFISISKLSTNNAECLMHSRNR